MQHKIASSSLIRVLPSTSKSLSSSDQKRCIGALKARPRLLHFVPRAPRSLLRRQEHKMETPDVAAALRCAALVR